MTGTVAWFNNAKGYGFLVRDDGGDDVFAHHTEIEADGYRTLTPNAKVEFEVGKSQHNGKLMAIKIRQIGS